MSRGEFGMGFDRVVPADGGVEMDAPAGRSECAAAPWASTKLNVASELGPAFGRGGKVIERRCTGARRAGMYVLYT